MPVIPVCGSGGGRIACHVLRPVSNNKNNWECSSWQRPWLQSPVPPPPTPPPKNPKR